MRLPASAHRPTLEHGITTDDEQFLVMEFLDGPGLNSLIVGRSPLLDGRRLALLRQAAEAIRPVHQSRLHPSRHLPAEFRRQPRRRLAQTDRLRADRPGHAALHGPRAIARARPTIWPPRWCGAAHTSPRLDIFSFGVTAYEMCAFALPWPKGQGKEAMTHGVEEPTPLAYYRPQIHPRLAEAIMACLASDPAKRPATMNDFLKLIKGIKAGGGLRLQASGYRFMRRAFGSLIF